MDDHVVPTVSRMDLTTIINRLEAATSRLEDMAASAIDLNGAPTPAPTGPLPPPPVQARAAPPEPPKPVVEPLPESVEDFDAFITGPVKKYVNLSDELGGLVAEQVWNNSRTRGTRIDQNYRLQLFCELLLNNGNSFSLQRKRRSRI